MFTDLYDIYATDDLNFILHSIKIAEKKKKNQSLAYRCVPPHSVRFSTFHSSYPSEKKKRAKQVFRVHRSTQTKKVTKSTKKNYKNTNLELFFAFLLGLLK